jgi:hypothetical protein
MEKNNFKQKFQGMPIEKHDTAASANISYVKPISKVPIPNENEIRNAKDWVDANEK